RVQRSGRRAGAGRSAARSWVRGPRGGNPRAIPGSHRTLRIAGRCHGGAGAPARRTTRRHHRRGRAAMSQDTTPLMQQYREIQARHADAILMFRMGDFYEMFYDAAETASRVLGLTLTARHNGGAADVPLAGVPVKAV